MSPRIKLLVVIVMIIAPIASGTAEWRYQQQVKAENKNVDETNKRDMAKMRWYRAWNERKLEAERLQIPFTEPYNEEGMIEDPADR